MSIAIADLRSWSEIQAARTLFKEYAEALPFGLGYQTSRPNSPVCLPLTFLPPGACSSPNGTPALLVLLG